MAIDKVIFILTDTVRAQNVGLYGKNPSSTPNIDSLKKNSWIFLNTYASATSTDPSVTSIVSGNYPLTNGLINHGKFVRAKEEENLSSVAFLPEILQKNGFKTAAIDWMGRWHKRGYDYYSGKIVEDFSKDISVAYKFPFPFVFRVLDKIAVKLLGREFFIRFYYAFIKNPKLPYDPADVVVDQGLKILEKNKQKKLFLYLHFWDAHVPHTRPRGLKSYLFDNVEKTYDAEIKFLDQEIGRLLNYLKESNQLENTLIVFTADHGENLSLHDMPFNHENLYQDVVRVPLIFYNLSFKPRVVKSLVQHVDILPTLLSTLKIAFPKYIDGYDLNTKGLRNKRPKRKFVYFEDITHRKLKLMQTSRRKGIFDGTFKYIKTLGGKEEKLGEIMTVENLKVVKEQLYNLKTDPQERINLSQSHKLKLISLRKNLEEHITLLNKKRISRTTAIESKLLKSTQIIKKAISLYGNKKIVIAWKGGKDTTVLMHIVKTIYKKIPLKVFFNDTTLEFKETYEFIEALKRLWNIELIKLKHSDEELAEYHLTNDLQRKGELSRLMKITAINRAVKKYKFKGFMLGIRRDETPARKNEKYFSKRKDHIRVHPLLDWTEEDIWAYTKNFGIPYNSLYDTGYRSIGEKGYTFKVSPEGGERAGRDPEKERLMSRLRRLGYW